MLKKIGLLGCLATVFSCAPANNETALNDIDPDRDVSFFVMVKSANYTQNADDSLTFLNNHMFSEIFFNEGAVLNNVTITRDADPDNVMPFEKRKKDYYMEGGHFDSVAELDAAYPNGDYTINFDMQGRTINSTMNIAGPNGNTDIPAPITITFHQDGERIPSGEIDAGKQLTIRWSDYSNGQNDPKGIVDDMIFVVMADCYGERITHTGLPFQGEYTKWDTTEVVVEAEFLKTGHPYSIFVEFPHVVDSSITNGVPGFMSYATATYMDLVTLGPDTSASCPADKIPMDTGQTDRMDKE
ncbi:hypothetical protein [Pseudemcibacter aquimaris]|uniref:hypothetical protein n=1 Tax=Pseudemcibacter aquimaris TaxID=2857064 RepID=UPI0020121EED|nr:hypothetical protein [Pseudemcibacter aquimaris]MCC3861740.1 hypothetical protein [Pseudemcibacter aquimaris]WDU58509.1 hypothetical protein KW060_15060 [Pseudemcibacter aquimaris]